MGTFGTSRLRRSSLSSKRSQQTIETLEAYLGRAFSSNLSNNTTSKETPSKRDLGNDTKGSMDKTNQR